VTKAIVFILTCALLQAVYAEDTTHQELAEELVSLMNIEENIEQSFEAVKEMQMRQLRSMIQSEEDMERATGMQTEVMDLIAEEMSWKKIKNDYIAIYAETFTDEELQGIIDFYKSPAGAAFVETTPALTRKSMELNQRQMMTMMPKLQRITREWREKTLAAQRAAAGAEMPKEPVPAPQPE